MFNLVAISKHLGYATACLSLCFCVSHVTILTVTFRIPQWEVSYHACCFTFGVKTSCCVGTHSNRQEFSTVCVFYTPTTIAIPPNTTQIHFSAIPRLHPSLSHTRRARLPVQEDVCSAHFNMNIIIVYLAAIRFSCHKPTQASSFCSSTA